MATRADDPAGVATDRCNKQALRVLYVIDTLEVGGTETSLLETLAHLDRRVIEPSICTIYRGNTLQPSFEKLDVAVESMGLVGKYEFVRAARRLRSVVRKARPDILHTMLFRSDQVGRWVGYWTRIPVISSFVNISYDPARITNNPLINPRKLAWLRRLDAFTARWVTRFHAVSDAVRDSNCRYLGVAPERVTVVPRGRDVAAFRQFDGQRHTIRKEMGVHDDRRVLLNVGRLVEQKAQADLIEAMRRLVTDMPNAELWIAGEGNQRQALERQISELGLVKNVRLLGQRADVPRLLAAADCFVFSSIYEGMPGAVIEAMLARLPIVATDLAVNREVVIHGETGILVPVRDAAAMANAVKNLMRDRASAREMGERARRAAEEKFDIVKVTKEMEKMYRDASKVGGRKSAAKGP